MNVSGTFNVFRLILDPSLCLPHAVIPSFAQLRIPLSECFPDYAGAGSSASVGGVGNFKPDIRAVVLDKDNCFAVPHSLDVHGPYSETFEKLKRAYPGNRLLIVSNTSGTLGDKDLKDAALLTETTGVPVLTHDTKKPGCHEQIMAHLRKSCPECGITSASQVAVVGDRLFTDVMMANMMGGWAVWVRDGVDPRFEGAFARVEKSLYSYLISRGYKPPVPVPVPGGTEKG